MEAINEAAKKIAMSRELIKQFIDNCNIFDPGDKRQENLITAMDLLDKAIEDLTSN